MKIITCPDECGFCDREDNYRGTKCKHPKAFHLTCKDPNKFPHVCPLDDAPIMNMMQIKNLLRKYLPNIQADALVEWMFGIGNIVPKVTNCAFYQEGRENPCVEGRFPNWAGACTGITCGHFKPK